MRQSIEIAPVHAEFGPSQVAAVMMLRPIASAFLDIAPVLAPGYVLVDLRGFKLQGLSIPRELKSRSIALPTILLDRAEASVASVVAALKAGAIDYLTVAELLQIALTAGIKPEAGVSTRRKLP